MKNITLIKIMIFIFAACLPWELSRILNNNKDKPKIEEQKQAQHVVIKIDSVANGNKITIIQSGENDSSFIEINGKRIK